MKILAFTDIHGSKKAIETLTLSVKKHRPDVIVCCGDISIFQMSLNPILKRLSSLGKQLILVNGNHEDPDQLERQCQRFPSISFIHNSHLSIGNFLFLGYGGDGFSTVDPIFAKVAASFDVAIEQHKGKKIILVTHAPPYNTKTDKILGGHCGNKTIRQFIERKQPSLALCGHIHENFGAVDKIKKTIVINPGPFGKLIELT